jgi:COPII coat assembly protein SEC16
MVLQPPQSTYSYPADDRGRTTSSTSAYAVPSVHPVVPQVPPEVNTAPYRPKVLNAYDPPLPPPKSKRLTGQSAFQAPSAYSSYAPPQQPLNVDAPPPVLPPPQRGPSAPYSPASNNTTLPPPPARKFTNPNTQHLQNGDGRYNYLPPNGDQYNSPVVYDAGHGQQHVTTSPPSVPNYDSSFASSSFSQPSTSSEATVQEFMEDPEGGIADTSAADQTPSLESDSRDTLNGSWSVDIGTMMPPSPRGNDGESLPTSFAALHIVEDTAAYDQYPPEEPISAAPASDAAPYDPYRPNGSKTIVPASRQDTQPSYGHQPLAPVRTSSPASMSSQFSYSEQRKPLHNPYAPGHIKSVQAYDPYFPPNRVRSASDGSVLSSQAAPYPPSSHLREQSSSSSEYGNYTSRYNYPDRPLSTTSERQAVIHPTSSIPAYPYAPSPSLLGTNDPLGRANVRIPVLSFGFGGKVVTCFHGASVLNTGFDVALSSRQSRDISIRSLCNIIPQSALEDTTASYPGPLFSDPGSPMAGLVRSGASTQTKSKKAKVIKYLEERIGELSSGVAYLNYGQFEYEKVEGKLILLKLLRIMVEKDGRLSGR